MHPCADCTDHLLYASFDEKACLCAHAQTVHEAVYMYELVEEVCTLIRPLVREDVSLENCVPSELPPAEGDRTRLMQVLFNLVGNASRFTLVRIFECDYIYKYLDYAFLNCFC